MSQMPGQTPPPPPPPPQMPYGSMPPAAPPSDPSERTFAMLCHIAALAGFVIPLGNIVGPLVVWLVKKEQSPLVEDQGRESLNFQISVMIYCIVSGILMFAVIGIFLLPVVLIFSLIMIIIAAMKANSGERYRYPLTIRFL